MGCEACHHTQYWAAKVSTSPILTSCQSCAAGFIHWVTSSGAGEENFLCLWLYQMRSVSVIGIHARILYTYRKAGLLPKIHEQPDSRHPVTPPLSTAHKPLKGFTLCSRPFKQVGRYIHRSWRMGLLRSGECRLALCWSWYECLENMGGDAGLWSVAATRNEARTRNEGGSARECPRES